MTVVRIQLQLHIETFFQTHHAPCAQGPDFFLCLVGMACSNYRALSSCCINCVKLAADTAESGTPFERVNMAVW